MQDSPGVRGNSLPVAANARTATVIDHSTVNATKTCLKTVVSIVNVCPGKCLT